MSGWEREGILVRIGNGPAMGNGPELPTRHHGPGSPGKGRGPGPRAGLIPVRRPEAQRGRHARHRPSLGAHDTGSGAVQPPDDASRMPVREPQADGREGDILPIQVDGAEPGAEIVLAQEHGLLSRGAVDEEHGVRRPSTLARLAPLFFQNTMELRGKGRKVGVGGFK